MYIVQCADESLYTGITTDITRRVEEHNSSSLWANYTKTRRPVLLVRSQECSDRSDASQQEYAIKKMTRAQKIDLIW